MHDSQPPEPHASATSQPGLVLVNRDDPDTWTVLRNRQGKDQRNEILTNQTNLTSEFATGELRHSLSTGVELIYEKQDNATFAAARRVQRSRPKHAAISIVAAFCADPALPAREGLCVASFATAVDDRNAPGDPVIRVSSMALWSERCQASFPSTTSIIFTIAPHPSCASALGARARALS